MLQVIIGLITVVISSVIVSTISQATNFNLQGFSIFFIFPIGAAIVGALGASGAIIGQKISKRAIKSSLIVLAAAFGFLTLAGTYYVDYLGFKNDIDSKYINLKSSFSSAELKKYEEQTSFVSYITFVHENSTSTISLRGSKKININNQWFSRLSFWLTVAGSALGGVILAMMAIGPRTKDRKTGEYRQLKFGENYSFETYEELDKAIKAKDFAAVCDKISNFSKDSSLNKIAHSKLYVLLSQKTGEGQIVLERLSISNNSPSTEAKTEYDVPVGEMEKILESIKLVQPKERF